MICLFCDKEAEWLRITQFAGTHPFCKEHADIQEDFLKDGGSSYFWRKVDETNS